MKRPMCVLSAAWLAGLLLAGRWHDFKLIFLFILYFILTISGLFFTNKHPKWLRLYINENWYPRLTLFLVLIPVLFGTGFFRMNQYTMQSKANEQAWRNLEEQGETYVTVEGVVIAKTCEEKIILELSDCAILETNGQKQVSAGNCRVSMETERKTEMAEAMIGNKIRVFGKFSMFQTAGNPGQFDAYSYYKSKGLYAEVKAYQVHILDEKKNVWKNAMVVLKQRLRESLVQLYSEENAGVLAAMLLGDKELLLDETEELYRKNGISHILAISGLHISMLCMGLYRLLHRMGISQRISVATAIAFLVFYIFFTGASTSSLRAGSMCLVLFGAKMLRRSYDLISSLALAAILVTALRPEELTSAGFLLSFGAVLGVAMAMETEYWLKKVQKKLPWWKIFLSGGMIQAVTMPVSLWFFYELSSYSLLLNLVVIPLVSLILGGGLFSSAFGTVTIFLTDTFSKRSMAVLPAFLAKLPAGGTSLLLAFYEWLCTMTQKLPFSFVLLGRPAVWQLILYYIVLFTTVYLFCFLAKKNCELATKTEERKKVHTALILLSGLLLCLGILFLPKVKQTELMFLDVSQGDGALIFTQENRVILSDCGSSDVLKVGEYRLMPVLKQRGVMLIDTVVVSHLDSDHISGIQELLEKMPVFEGNVRFAAGYDGTVGIKELVLPKVKVKSEEYQTLEELAKKKKVVLRYLEAGELLYQEKNLLIECLSPQNAENSENDTSLVLLLQTPELIAWLMGDAETGSEEKLVKQLLEVNPIVLSEEKLVLLKVGHHGSKTSSGEEFIRFVQPEVAVISCGYRNSYGHPHAVVLERLSLQNSRVFRTDVQGAILVKLGGKRKVSISGWKE